MAKSKSHLIRLVVLETVLITGHLETGSCKVVSEVTASEEDPSILPSTRISDPLLTIIMFLGTTWS